MLYVNIIEMSFGFLINIWFDIIEILFVLVIVIFGREDWKDDLRDIICLMMVFFLVFGNISVGGFMFFLDGISCNFFMFDL